MNTTFDYTGRQKDLLIFRGTNPTSPNATNIAVEFSKNSSFCAGVQKLIQRYAILLMTEITSQTEYPDFGTEFLTKIKNGGNLNINDFRHIFNFANAKVISNLRSYQQQNPSDFLDEEINTATLESVVRSGDAIFLNIRLITMAGENLTFLYPLPTN